MERVRLQGGLDRTASWVCVDDEGRLVVECFDFSEDAHDFFGNDVAFTLTVDAALKPAILARLDVAEPDAGNVDDVLLETILARFESYFAVKDWLERERIPFAGAFDPHA
jgi:hypothetical protein